MCVIQVPYDFPFIDDGVDWNCFHWYIDLKESSSRERGREEENQFFAVIAAAAAPTPPPSKIFLATPPLYGRFFFFFPSSKPFEVGEVGDGCLASLQQTPRKRNTVGTWYLNNEMGLIFRICLKRKIRIEYTWYWECVLLLLLCSCMKICIIDWL